jgi:hypothetical protein
MRESGADHVFVYRRRVSAAAGLVAAAILVVFLLVASPIAGATPLVRDTPPYAVAKAFKHSSPPWIGTCATSDSYLVGVPRVDPTTGVVHAGAWACATGPAPGGPPNYPYITTDYGFRGPSFTASSTGSHQVAYQWKISWNASGYSYLSGRPDIAVKLFGNLYDQTTKTWMLGAPPNGGDWITVFDDNRTFVSVGVDQSYTLRFDVTLTSGDTYEFYTGMHTSTVVYAATYYYAGKWHYGYGVALLNVDSDGNGATVLSMSVT